MPIEIRELVIRASVSEAPAESQKLEALVARLKAELIDACISKIEERIERITER